MGALDNAADHARELWGRVGLRDSHGRHFIHGGVQAGRNPGCNIMSHPVDNACHVGFQQKNEDFKSSVAQLAYEHNQGTKDKMDRYFTLDRLEKVQEELYPDDYKLWKLAKENGTV